MPSFTLFDFLQITINAQVTNLKNFGNANVALPVLRTSYSYVNLNCGIFKTLIIKKIYYNSFLAVFFQLSILAKNLAYKNEKKEINKSKNYAENLKFPKMVHF